MSKNLALIAERDDVLSKLDDLTTETMGGGSRGPMLHTRGSQTISSARGMVERVLLTLGSYMNHSVQLPSLLTKFLSMDEEDLEQLLLPASADALDEFCAKHFADRDGNPNEENPCECPKGKEMIEELRRRLRETQQQLTDAIEAAGQRTEKL